MKDYSIDKMLLSLTIKWRKPNSKGQLSCTWEEFSDEAKAPWVGLVIASSWFVELGYILYEALGESSSLSGEEMSCL